MDIKVRSGRVNLVYGGYSRPEGVYHSSICHSFLWLWGVLINWLVGLSCIYWERAKNAKFGEQIWIWANYGGWRGLSASLINWGSGSNWRRCSPTKPAAENLSMHCNATHHIWNWGRGEGGLYFFTFHSCVFQVSRTTWWHISGFVNEKKWFFSTKKIPQEILLLKLVPESSHQTGSFGVSQHIGILIFT